jgi:hypothetical protein
VAALALKNLHRCKLFFASVPPAEIDKKIGTYEQRRENPEWEALWAPAAATQQTSGGGGAASGARPRRRGGQQQSPQLNVQAVTPARPQQQQHQRPTTTRIALSPDELAKLSPGAVAQLAAANRALGH